VRSLALILLLATFASAQTKTPVVVELFTSEGCSSCPPADQLLFKLEQQPVAGADIIVLGEHVDYWDQLGWRDRFSSAAFTNRQENYARAFGIAGPYTPQMVINGRVEFVGNDAQEALRRIADQKSPKSAPQLLLTQSGDHLHVSVTGANRSLNVFCAIAERDLSTHVGNGENRGRDLRHTGVVRQLTKLGSTRDGRFDSDFPLRLAPDWKVDNLHAVVFLQHGSVGDIVTATQIALNQTK